MTQQTHAARRAITPLILLLVLSEVASSALAAAPAVTSAATRKAHGGINYDLGMPLSGTSGIEPREISAGITVVLNFDQAVSAGSASISAGTATVSGAPTFSNGSMLINLTGVANAQSVTVSYTGVTAPGNGTAASGTFTFRTLLCDVNGSGNVTVSDVNMVKYYTGQAVDGFTYRSDVNGSGNITVSDVNLVKYSVGTSVTGGAATNTVPTISNVADVATNTGTATAAIPFTVGDGETPAGAISVKATSDNQALLPDANITLAGSGAARTIKLTPAAAQTGSATVTLLIGDGLYTATDTFKLTVADAPVAGGTVKLFVTTLSPEGTAASAGTGTSTLQLSADETYAIVKVNYSNLTTSKTGMHIHGPADPGTAGSIIFDLDTTPTQADGSWKWTFVQTGTITVADQITALKVGRLYVNVHSSRYPSGELRGHFALVNGSQTFTPPPAPPTLPVTTPTQAEAARFLLQATYGPTDQSINDVVSQNYDTWITNQLNLAQTLQVNVLAFQKSQNGGTATTNQLWNSWWQIANTAPDQLRHRMAFTLSELFVVSEQVSVINEYPDGLALYYDLLGKGATGNFRQLMEDVTLSPVMGEYLNLRGSIKGNTTTGTNPNENYARELLQLFTIGLYQLHPDGTYKLDANGQLIPTYNQDVVIGFARALTGWNYNQSGDTNWNPPRNFSGPMTPVTAMHETGSKLLLNGVTVPAGGNNASDLKAALDNIFAHPNVGPFICKQLIKKMVCSNPSPGYVYRVVQKFENNGSGVRGDMKAVVRAILTDYEARAVAMSTQQGFGKLQEPLLRTTAAMRALHAASGSGIWAIDRIDNELGQTPLSAPTVFNWYEPGYIQPGPLAQNGLVAPEFQMTTETTSMMVSNWFYQAVVNPSGGFKWGDIKPVLTSETTLAANPSALVDRLNITLCGGSLSAAAKTIIVNHLNTISDNATRARVAAYLIIISPQCAVLR